MLKRFSDWIGNLVMSSRFQAGFKAFMLCAAYSLLFNVILPIDRFIGGILTTGFTIGTIVYLEHKTMNISFIKKL